MLHILEAVIDFLKMKQNGTVKKNGYGVLILLSPGYDLLIYIISLFRFALKEYNGLLQLIMTPTLSYLK